MLFRSTRVLVDCGLSPREAGRRLARLGLGSGDLHGILLTHEHDDHAGQAYACAAAWNLPVWLTHGTQVAMTEAGKQAGKVATHTIHGRLPFAMGDLQVLPYTVPHDAREPVQYVLSDGAFRLGVLTDIGASTAHVEATLSGCDALVLETNHDLDMLWRGPYPEWLKDRVAGRLGHLDNATAGELLGAIDSSRLRHLVAAHLSEKNNTPDLARAALVESLGCDPHWLVLATQERGTDWLPLDA